MSTSSRSKKIVIAAVLRWLILLVADLIVFAVAWLLAAYLAGPIIKGLEGAKVAAQMRQAAARVRGEAASADANSGAEQAEHMPEALLRRL